MKCIKKIVDEDFGLKSVSFNNPKERIGARGIIFNDKGEVAILWKEFKHEYKLIGGGLENGETPEEAFKREALEEAGCKIEIDEFIGMIEELKSLDNFKQTSYVYLAHVTCDTKKLHLTDIEKEGGAKLLWLSLPEAILKVKNAEDKLLATEHENVYHTRFIVRRDYEILNYYKNLMP